MRKRQALGKSLAQIMQEQKARGQTAEKIELIRKAETAAEKKRRAIEAISKIPFEERYASPREREAFFQAMTQMREVQGIDAEIEGKDIEAARRLSEKFRNPKSPLHKTDVQLALALRKKYGSHRA